MTGKMIDKIKNALRNELPGNEAHLEMISYARPSADVIRKLGARPKQSAVIILLYEQNGELYFPLIRRPEYDGVHSRQIGLPGGQSEPDDKDLNDTAIRECAEETGALAENIHVLGKLTEIYIPPSNFLVRPVVGYYSPYRKFTADPSEVAEIITVSLKSLLKMPIEMRSMYIRNNPHKTNVACFIIGGHVVWGATAMMLNEFRHIIRSHIAL